MSASDGHLLPSEKAPLLAPVPPPPSCRVSAAEARVLRTVVLPVARGRCRVISPRGKALLTIPSPTIVRLASSAPCSILTHHPRVAALRRGQETWVRSTSGEPPGRGWGVKRSGRIGWWKIGAVTLDPDPSGFEGSKSGRTNDWLELSSEARSLARPILSNGSPVAPYDLASLLRLILQRYSLSRTRGLQRPQAYLLIGRGIHRRM